MKKIIIALCTAFAAGCQHSPEVRISTYDPCFVYPVGTKFAVGCSWDGARSDFNMKGCFESVGIPVTETIRPGETRSTFDQMDGPQDGREAIRRANAMRECISKGM